MSRLMLIASAILLAPSALAPAGMAQEHDHSGHAPAQPQQPAEDHSQHQPQSPGSHAGHDMSEPQAGHGAHLAGALGGYTGTRDGSGTSWIPETAEHDGVHAEAGAWSLMGHATLDGVYTSQGGPRGDNLAYVGGMIMGSAKTAIGDRGRLQLRGSISPDPLMGDHGYPLLLAAGETADGVETLVDRQHPHDFVMELSATYSHQIADDVSVFVYGGLPGEPAFGPPAFMHRPAAMANPEAPITHHWLDSTHITFGVVTTGVVVGPFKVDASRFRGREPDENRWDIETGELDSTAARISWNPIPELALQASWADVTSPEQLEPDVDVAKWSASALYTGQSDAGVLSLTGAFARKKDSEDVTLDAWLGEASFSPRNTPWTIFSRAEAIETNELGLDHHGPIENVARLTLGASYDFALTQDVTMAVGASATQNWTSGALSLLYDGDPVGVMGFVRFRIG